MYHFVWNIVRSNFNAIIDLKNDNLDVIVIFNTGDILWIYTQLYSVWQTKKYPE